MTRNNHWFDIAVKLKEEKIAEPILWLGDQHHFIKAKEKFGSGVVKDFDFFKFKSHKISGSNYTGKFNDFFMSKNYLIAKDRSIKMMDRLDDLSMMSRLDREAIFNKTVIWTLNMIERQSPDALITIENTHTHIQHTIFQICRFLNIPCLKFNAWTHLPLLSLENIVNGKQIPVTTEINKTQIETFSKAIKELVYTLNTNSKDYKTEHTEIYRLKSNKISWKTKQLTTILKDTFRKYKSQANYLESKNYNPINPYNLNPIQKLKIIKRRRKNLKKELKLNIHEDLSLNEDFIYYGLHYEPERTTLPDGGIFHDQFLAIIKLRELIPSQIKIYVKEHPSMFYDSLWGYRGRSPLFYRLLSNIDNVRILSHKIKTLDLINASLFTSTISGTLGLESAVLGKKSLTFGDTWYNGCPNTIKWSDTLKYDSIINAEVFDKERIVSFLTSKLKKESVIGLLNSTTKSRFERFIDDDFDEIQFKGIFRLLNEFFKSI